jgi:hypothetical protein
MVAIEAGVEANAPDLLRVNCRFRCNVPLLRYPALMPVELKAKIKSEEGVLPVLPCLIEIGCFDACVRGS